MKRANSRSTLFLGEIVLALLIFALSSAVCLGLLFHAYQISGASLDLNRAVVNVQSAAETFKSQPQLDKVATLLGGDVRSGVCYVYYNEDWRLADQEDAVFTMLIRPRQESGVVYAEISLNSEAGPIFALTAAAYEGEGAL